MTYYYGGILLREVDDHTFRVGGSSTITERVEHSVVVDGETYTRSEYKSISVNLDDHYEKFNNNIQKEKYYGWSFRDVDEPLVGMHYRLWYPNFLGDNVLNYAVRKSLGSSSMNDDANLIYSLLEKFSKLSDIKYRVSYGKYGYPRVERAKNVTISLCIYHYGSYNTVEIHIPIRYLVTINPTIQKQKTLDDINSILMKGYFGGCMPKCFTERQLTDEESLWAMTNIFRRVISARKKAKMYGYVGDNEYEYEDKTLRILRSE